MTPAEEMSAAADRLDALAHADGITPGPWQSLDHGDRLLYDGPGADHQPPVYVVDEPMSNGANADYIAAMHPGVGAALADLLRQAAALTGQPVDDDEPALRIARHINRQQGDPR